MAGNDRRVELLDCTLRDGSYANNFQFTARDTRKICEGLDRSGLRKIEVGHGLGLGASSPKNGIAFEGDMEYIEAAREGVRSAKLGAFFVVGIGELERIHDAADRGLDFLRIGCDVTRVSEAGPAIEMASRCGLEVYLNLMKTYALPADEVGASLTEMDRSSIEAVYVVDSAGCMLPGDVSEYTAMLVGDGWAAGFHGHNNLELANANCLAAADAGARYLDGTLCGMGRSAGNAQTEIIGWLLHRAGYEVAPLDTARLFELADRYLKPLMFYPQGKSALDIVTGMSRFHSGYLPRFRKALDRYDVNLYRLIERVSAIDCIDPSEELIFEVARDLNRTDS